MITSCNVTEAAVRLTGRLQAQSIPDDYVLEGAYWEVMLDVRGRFTNYRSLRQALPACPPNCPIATNRGEPAGQGCFNYDLAHDILRTDARWLAWYLFRTWQAGKKEVFDNTSEVASSA